MFKVNKTKVGKETTYSCSHNGIEVFKIVTITDFFEKILESPIHSIDVIVNPIMPGMGESITIEKGILTIQFIVFGTIREKLVISDKNVEYITNETKYYKGFKYGDLANKLLRISNI